MSGLLSGNEPVKPEATAEDINDFFNKPVEDKPVKEDKLEEDDDKPIKKAPKEEDDEEKDDEIKDDEELELKDDEDLEDEEKLDLKDDEIKIEVPPKKREIVAKYPNFFKEFPAIEKMIYRDRQYSELFGSFDDAKEVAEQAQVLQEFENDILNGSTEKILTSVKQLDKKAYDKLIDNYLPTLHKVDKEAYFEVIGNVGKTIIAHMVKEARSSENEELQKAARLLNQFLFASSTYTPPKQRVSQVEDKDNEVERERNEYIRERFESSRDELQTKVDNVLRGTISEYIDPKGEMSAYVKKNAINDAIKALHEELSKDAPFRKTLDRLWNGVFQDKFSKNSIDRVRSAYLGRSKQSLASIIKKARAEALKGSVPASRKREDDEEETPRKRGLGNTGRPHQSSGKLQMKPGESVADFFARD